VEKEGRSALTSPWRDRLTEITGWHSQRQFINTLRATRDQKIDRHKVLRNGSEIQQSAQKQELPGTATCPGPKIQEQARAGLMQTQY